MKLPSLPVAALLTVAISLMAGCSDPTSSYPKAVSMVVYTNSLPDKVEFELPNPDVAFSFARKEKGRGRDTPIVSKPFELKSGKWQLWYAANVWSSKGPLSATARVVGLGEHLMAVDKFRKANHLDIEINFVQTDRVSKGLGMRTAELTQGWSISPTGGVCDPFYFSCVDNYVISPFGRDGISDAEAQYAWLEPYDQNPEWVGESMDGYRGYHDKKSEYWNQTPPAVFLVNPDGDVVDIFSPLLHGATTSPGMIVRALIENMDLAGGDLKFPAVAGDYLGPTINDDVRFGGDYTEAFLEEFSKALQ